MIASESLVTLGVRARALFEGHDIADSADVVVVRDPGRAPAYYFPRRDVFMIFLRETGKVTRNADKGEARYFTIYRDQHIVENVAWSYAAPPQAFAAIAGRIAFHPAHVEFQVDGRSSAETQEDDDPEIASA
ncbi:nucleotidyltransferase domain-containing protein [Caulobacter flavus]|uniref:Nucleotidyltransferase domain-containing protein n=1 Tax=Caulobacter flavus TaxID=1679497 RepID=A0A2N5CKF1_9CAUL|nr:DUF427 domain-containing protein [Caulobacter flavus]AYV47676.1 nucleotidyltransferase domain-containing protein [Caulobacter flavus]PLR05826.1 nucleotidyltransferase domain-containing protein [Caulobacter flavus]